MFRWQKEEDLLLEKIYVSESNDPFWDIDNGETRCDKCHALVWKESVKDAPNFSKFFRIKRFHNDALSPNYKRSGISNFHIAYPLLVADLAH